MRIFVALDTPPSVRTALHAARKTLAASDVDVRWDPPDKYHCTLLFLGDIADTAVDEVTRLATIAVEEAHSFDASYAGLGFFPTPARARVVWAGIHDDGSCTRLHEALVDVLRRFLPEEKSAPFHPHITLGRIRSQRNLARLTTIMESCTFDHPPVTVREIRIFKSDLRPAGSVYTVLRSIPLSP
jgi:2'-5' RNA ligase